jgi:hypothetical protein
VALGIGNSAEPARTGFDLTAAAVMFLAVCWMSPKLASAILGGATTLTGGDFAAVGVGLGAGAAAVAMTGAAIAHSSTEALSKVRSASGEASAPGSGRGPTGGGAFGGLPSPSPTGSGGRGPGAFPSGSTQPPPPQRGGGASASQQSSPPPLGRSIMGLAERAFAVAEETGGATRSALRRLRIPHDGGGHAPPTIPTGHGEE